MRSTGEYLRIPAACQICGANVFRRRKKTCSSACASASKTMTWSTKPPRSPRTPNRLCVRCGKEFHAYKSSPRKYCSYACFVASGGPLLAGAAAVRARVRYGAKKDANHKEVVSALEKCGAFVLDLSGLGGGVPDCVVCLRSVWHLVEIKNPTTSYGKRGANKYQKKWAENWRGGKVYLLHSVEEALAFANGELDGIKWIGV